MIVIAYIFYNPVRAGIVNKINDYKWCSYSEINESNDNPIYDMIFNQFHKDREKGRLAFRKWVENIDNY